MRDDHDLVRADLNPVIRDKAERDDLAPADHAMPEIAEMPRALLPRPAEDIRRVAHHQAHPFGPGHPVSSAKVQRE
jgi:hypothetical protein